MTEEMNPYSAPTSRVEVVERARPIEPASRPRRLGTFVADQICYFVCCMIFGAAVAIAFGEQGIDALQQVPDFVLGAVLLIVYYMFFEGIWARTPGKLIFGTVVVDDFGKKPTIGQVLGRTLCRFLPFEMFSFLGSRGWHDGIPHTHVVRSRPIRQEA